MFLLFSYSIEELSQQCIFEEVAHLLLYDELPTKTQLNDLRERMLPQRVLPDGLKLVLEQLPKDAHPMVASYFLIIITFA